MSIPVKTKLSWPVTIEEAKRHLRIDDTFNDDDAYIENLIYAATVKAEQYIGKDIAETDNVWQIYDFFGIDLNINEGNFISLTQVVSDASIGIAIDHIETFYNYTRVSFNDSIDSDPLTVYYKTGYLENECPILIQQAILIKIGDLYDIERQSYIISLQNNRAFELLLNSYRKVSW